MDPDVLERLVDVARKVLPDLQAFYAFGSRVRGDSTAQSDLDLAVLTPERLDPQVRFALQESLAAVARCDIDLVDLRAATTVMRASVFRSDRLLYEGDARVRAWFEMMALSDYARLSEERRGILEDVAQRGTVLS